MQRMEKDEIPGFEEEDDFTRELVDELEKMLVLGLVEIVGTNDKGEDLFRITERGKLAAEAFRSVSDETMDPNEWK